MGKGQDLKRCHNENVRVLVKLCYMLYIYIYMYMRVYVINK